MTAEDRLHAVVDPIIDELQLELVDLVYAGGRVKVTIDHADGLDTELLTKATRMISHEIDIEDPIKSGFTLEVTSPGVERPLRTQRHFERSIGEKVSLKLISSHELRRLKGELLAADADGVTVEGADTTHTIAYDQIDKAKTVFDWGPGPKPGKGPKPKQKSSGSSTASPKG